MLAQVAAVIAELDDQHRHASTVEERDGDSTRRWTSPSKCATARTSRARSCAGCGRSIRWCGSVE
ncbi:MAG: hypothetical protein MZV65_13310 [Chromatiales bacterium]|nr:hypothetical protein [Chromatiales bacterium]